MIPGDVLVAFSTATVLGTHMPTEIRWVQVHGDRYIAAQHVHPLRCPLKIRATALLHLTSQQG
jgi:hypothetical protein